MTRSVTSFSFIDPSNLLNQEETNKEETSLPEAFSDELKCHVFSYLSLDSKEMASVALVCKEWNAMSSDPYIAAQQLEFCKSLSYPQIQNWQLVFKNRCHQELGIIEVIKKCPNLKSLDLSEAPIDDQMLQNISNPQLEELILNKCGSLIKPDLNGFLGLKVLILNSCTKLVELKS